MLGQLWSARIPVVARLVLLLNPVRLEGARYRTYRNQSQNIFEELEPAVVL
jgi:hypothetical protein